MYVELPVYVEFDDVPSVDSLIAGADPTGGGGRGLRGLNSSTKKIYSAGESFLKAKLSPGPPGPLPTLKYVFHELQTFLLPDLFKNKKKLAQVL